MIPSTHRHPKILKLRRRINGMKLKCAKLTDHCQYVLSEGYAYNVRVQAKADHERARQALPWFRR